MLKNWNTFLCPPCLSDLTVGVLQVPWAGEEPHAHNREEVIQSSVENFQDRVSEQSTQIPDEFFFYQNEAI